jgi:CheY-like chemotaxis protein
MNCPRCKTPVGPLPGPDSIVTCPGCGSRLMSRSAALRSGAAKPAAPAWPPVNAAAAADEPPTQPSLEKHPPSSTLAPTPVRISLERPAAAASEPAPAGVGEDTKRSAKKEKEKDTKPGKGRPKGPSDVETVLPREQPSPVQVPEAPDHTVAAAPPPTLETLLTELRAVRRTQEQILALLRQGSPDVGAGSAPAAAPAEEGEPPALSPIRVRRRKTVVLVDDERPTREAAVAELIQADVPVRAFDDGNAALSAIAAEKPDVIILELALAGDMSGKDLINMIKATMEWVDIPIVLWTRETVANQKEARQIHGADEVVLKADGAAALVARIITVFRRG